MIGRDGCVVLPGSFLPVAEKYGLIVRDRPVGRSRRRSDGRRAATASWRSTSRRPRLGTADLLSFITRELHESGADPANLVFEITETALMQ